MYADAHRPSATVEGWPMMPALQRCLPTSPEKVWDRKPREVRLQVRHGYSLLELMIALMLLVGLLAAGWSMLATYRDAEQRGWRLVERTQAVRVTQNWLQNDLLHIAQPDFDPANDPEQDKSTTIPSSTRQASPTPSLQRRGSRNSTTGYRPVFVGNPIGFSVSIAPSIDPVPFYEQLLNGSSSQPARSLTRTPFDAASSRDGSFLDEAFNESVEKPLWPLKNVQVKYELVHASEALGGAEFVPVFDLVRRESVDRSQLQDAIQAAEGGKEKVLTINDLYRQDDSTSRENQILLQENRLPGLTNAEFWYCDGSTWKRSWNSNGGRLPAAVALTFDHAPRQKQIATRQSTTDFGSSPSDRLNRQDTLFDNDRSSIDEPVLESSSDGFELLQRDVRLVILLEQRPTTKSVIAANGGFSDSASQRGTVSGQPRKAGSQP
jgi:prepilin-type N-terminal cleavage/methylation domain-containing protein